MITVISRNVIYVNVGNKNLTMSVWCSEPKNTLLEYDTNYGQYIIKNYSDKIFGDIIFVIGENNVESVTYENFGSNGNGLIQVNINLKE